METVSLNVPDGHGVSRIDVYSSSSTIPLSDPPYTTTNLLDTFDRKSTLDRDAYNQQVELERDNGIIFDYGGSKYRGTITSRTDSKELEQGGYLEGFEAVITTSRKQWVDASVKPIIGAKIKAAGVTYRIASIVKNNPHFQINLTKHRGG